jgi:outer membrane protein insertion porin family
MRSRVLIIALCVASVLSVPAIYAQTSDDDYKTVISVRVENNRAISSETILSKLRTRVGEKFSQDLVNEDLKRLYATDYFSDVSVDAKDEAGGVAVTFVVEEKPVIDTIELKGNVAFRAPKLLALMKSKTSEMLNLAILAQDIAEIRDFYVKKGYPMTEVRYELDVDKDTNKAKITVIVDEKAKVKISRIDIVGNKAIGAGAIRKVLSTKPAWLFNPGIFKDEVLEEDVEKIKALYDDIGYLDAEVVPKLEYSADGLSLVIVIEIKENKQYLVGDITLKGNLVLPEKDVRSKITMKSGKPFANKTLRMDAAEIKQLYYNKGYMNLVEDVERSLNQDTGRIDITYDIDAKEVVYVGKIDICGNTKTRELIVRRELRIYPGDKFSGEKIKRSKERIYNLGFFENVAFDTEPTENPEVQNLIVSVKETKTGEFSFGGGYSSIDYLIGFVEVSQRNFDILNFPGFTGGGQSLIIKAEFGYTRQNYNIGWLDPWIFGLPYSAGFDLYRISHNQRGNVGYAYDETRTGFDLKVGKEITDHLKAGLLYRLEQVEISNMVSNASPDMRAEVGTNMISSLTLDLSYDRRDNIFNPGKGYLLAGAITDAGGIFFGDKNFVKGTGTAAYYHTFFEKVVLELKGRAGFADAYGDSGSVPIYERFFAGGANTIRGYKERRVGPRDSGSNEPVGGDAILVGNVEVTFPIYEKMLKGAVFYDIGNVWRGPGDILSGDSASSYKSGAGIGIRVKTPIGPVKVDWGYPLNSNYEDDRTGEFYFSMSRGF